MKELKVESLTWFNLHISFVEITKDTEISLMEIFTSTVYKKTDEWYIEGQRVTASGTTSENEWQRVVQQVTTSGTTRDNEEQWMTTSDNE